MEEGITRGGVRMRGKTIPSFSLSLSLSRPHRPTHRHPFCDPFVFIDRSHGCHWSLGLFFFRSLFFLFFFIFFLR